VSISTLPDVRIHPHASSEAGILANAYLIESANGIWIMETEPRAAFVGDLVFNGTHVYTADDHILARLAHLELARDLLANVPTLYPGHGGPGSLDLLDAQRDYLRAYCATVKELAARMNELRVEIWLYKV
jgi:glyoxylase-like metal-dependent hydrolase (beta-lactamase superfamily II)